MHRRQITQILEQCFACENVDLFRNLRMVHGADLGRARRMPWLSVVAEARGITGTRREGREHCLDLDDKN